MVSRTRSNVFLMGCSPVTSLLSVHLEEPGLTLRLAAHVRVRCGILLLLMMRRRGLAVLVYWSVPLGRGDTLVPGQRAAQPFLHAPASERFFKLLRKCLMSQLWNFSLSRKQM